MANLILKIQNSEFVESNHVYETEFSSKRVVANGWKAEIRDNGKIFCEAVRKYTDGVYSIRYIVNPKGYAVLSLKVNNKIKTLARGHVCPKGEGIQNGILSLAGGRIDERFAYFRCESFVNLLNKYNLKGVKHKNPNRDYVLEDSLRRGRRIEDSIKTDGQIDRVEEKEIFVNEKNNEFKTLRTVSLKNATWAIHESEKDRFLYTLKHSVEDLNLPR